MTDFTRPGQPRVKSLKTGHLKSVKCGQKASVLALAEARKRERRLAQELKRKDKALAETAALLVLRKKPRPSGGTARKNDS